MNAATKIYPRPHKAQHDGRPEHLLAKIYRESLENVDSEEAQAIYRYWANALMRPILQIYYMRQPPEKHGRHFLRMLQELVFQGLRPAIKGGSMPGGMLSVLDSADSRRPGYHDDYATLSAAAARTTYLLLDAVCVEHLPPARRIQNIAARVRKCIIDPLDDLVVDSLKSGALSKEVLCDSTRGQRQGFDKRRRILAALEVLEQQGRKITFQEVARRAEVSLWLTQREGIREHIDAARQRQRSI